MTVKEMIEELQKLNENLQVTVQGSKDCHNIVEIKPCISPVCRRMATHLVVFRGED